MMKNMYNKLKFTWFFNKTRRNGLISFLFNKYTFLNVNALIFVVMILYKFFSGLMFDIGLISLIISFFISYLISSFVLNKFKFSDNSFIRFLQKFIMLNIIMFILFGLAGYLLSLFNLIPTVYCSSDENMNKILTGEGNNSSSANSSSSSSKEVVKVTESADNKYYELKLRKDVIDKGVDTIGKVGQTAFETVIPNIGVGTAAGAASAAAIKATSGMPIIPRMFAVGGTALGVAAGTSLGMSIGQSIAKNIKLENNKKDKLENNSGGGPSESRKDDTMNVSSNDDTRSSSDNFSIKSPLENSEMNSPLQDLLLYSYSLDIIILLLVILILFIIFNKYILSFNLKIIKFIINKYCSDKSKEWINRRISKGLDYNHRFVLILLIINSITLVLIVLLKLYLTSELYINIDSYVEVHNYLKESCTLLLINKNNFFIKLKTRSALAKPIKLKILNVNSKDFNSRAALTPFGGKGSVIINDSNRDEISLNSKNNDSNKNIILNNKENLFMVIPKVKDIMLNSNVINNDIMLELENKLKNIIFFMISMKPFLSKKDTNKCFKELNEVFNKLNISNEYFKQIQNFILNYSVNAYESESDKNDNIKFESQIDERILQFIHYAGKRDIVLKDNLLIQLKYVIICIYKHKDEELIKICNNTLNELEIFFSKIANETQKSLVGGRKNIGKSIYKDWSSNTYNKEFNKALERSINKININILSSVKNSTKSQIEEINNAGEVILNIIYDLNHSIALQLFNRYNNEYISDKPHLESKIRKINKDNILDFIDNSINRNLTVFEKEYKNINSMKLLDSRINNLNLLESPLLKSIKSIIESELSNKDKQIQIERYVLKYEMDYFKENIDNPGVNNIILHNFYTDILNGYNKLIKEYTLNRNEKIKKELNTDKEINAIIVLMFMYLGVDKCVSFSFSQLLKLINNNENCNRTNILYSLSRVFIKVFKLSDHNKLNNNLTSLYNIEDLKNRITQFTEIDKYHLGEALLLNITRNCNIVKEDTIFKNKYDSEIIIRLNDKFSKELLLNSINILQLPMLCEPRELKKEDIYLPYYLTDTSALNLEGNIFKSKFDQSHKTRGSSQFYKGINYINNIKFKINTKMLNYILKEWNDENSIIFDGYNKYLEILDSDTQLDKTLKTSHNAKYHLNRNIISIASLYKDMEFYLPVFADFRGRLYTFSNYLSYQGNDLSRSLILFSKGEKLNKDGKICLDIYLSNLAGYDKLPWSERLIKSKDILKEFIQNSVDSLNRGENNSLYNNFLIKNQKIISEPFQFMSIIFAELELEFNSNSIVYNPILFDASTSGIQHIAALTLEKELAKNVNLYSESLNPENDLPNDFYTYALETIRKKLKESDNDKFKNISLSRKIIKKSVMTIPYNISLTGIGLQLMEHCSKVWEIKQYLIKLPKEATLDQKELIISSKEFGELCKIIYITLTKELPSLKQLTDYFNSIISLLVKLDLPVVWHTPVGLKISFRNTLYKSIRTKAKLLPKSKPVTISLPTSKADITKMKSSFMPNFIHSLDAANIHLLLLKLKNENSNLPVYTIHDCFASTPNNMALLEFKVKEAFIEIYFKDEGYLKKFHYNIINQIKDIKEVYEIDGKYYISLDMKTNIQIPDLPECFKTDQMGSFIKGLLNSKYFIG